MKRYLVFWSPQYYPEGGMNDFIGDYDDFTKALEVLTKLPEKEDLGWDISIGHIYDLMKKEIVYERQGDNITIVESPLDQKKLK